VLVDIFSIDWLRWSGRRFGQRSIDRAKTCLLFEKKMIVVCLFLSSTLMSATHLPFSIVRLMTTFSLWSIMSYWVAPRRSPEGVAQSSATECERSFSIGANQSKRQPKRCIVSALSGRVLIADFASSHDRLLASHRDRARYRACRAVSFLLPNRLRI
jgi:hypothetical protein